jgi:signal transduction histidine kinase
MVEQGGFPYGGFVLATLLRPWTTTRMWRAFVHAMLDIVIGAVTFTIVLTLLVVTVALLITFPLALPFAWLLSVSAAGLGAMERSRASALLDVHVSWPHQPFVAPEHRWFRRLGERVKSPSRWREIAYHLLLLPMGAVTFAVNLAVWCGSFALVALPFYVSALPGDSAEFGLFDVSSGAAAWLACLVGIAGVVLVAPWTTTAVGIAEGAVVRRLLGPSREHELEAEVHRIEASRVAAVGSAEAERRRIERDLHDGAQQRLVALAMDLGMARERFDEDPEQTRQLVAEAHEEAKAALGELRDLVRGFHPAILEDRGLDAALSAVVARCPVPVDLDVDVPERPSPTVESAAYYVVTEALTNVAKHSGADRARVSIARRGDRLVIDVSDNGRGGADAAGGTGLHGLAERVQGLGGWMTVMSPTGGPTSVLVELPCAS